MAEKKMLSDYPLLVEEWDYEKNMGLNPKRDLFSGRTRIWWLCSEYGHSWNAIIANRVKGSGCPYCTGNKILQGFNDLFTVHPELKNDWDFSKNNDLGIDASVLGVGSGTKVWWKCKKDPHSFEASPASILRGRSCPYCANKKVLVGFNDFATTASGLLKEWDHKRNVLTPEEITSGSDKMVHWICEKNHLYSMTAYRRTGKNSRGCPVCAGKKVVQSTSIVNIPEVIKLWDYEKNTVEPGTVSPGSNKKYWWMDDCGHSFQKSPKFIKNGSKCPYCSGSNTRLLKGYNDLETKAPHLVKEWSNKNNTLTPSDFVAGSKKKAWWICSKGHEWETIIEYRYRKRSSCPKCSMKGTSKAEKELQSFIAEFIPNNNLLFNDYRTISPQELDIHVPDRRIAIEFNGLYWHSEAMGTDKNYHYEKWKKCHDQGIQLITIWEDDWRDRRKVIESMLKHKLGLSNENKVYARKTIGKVIDNNEAKIFLSQYHIQGFKNITKNFGLFNKDTDELVAVMSFSTDKDKVILDRYATSCSVVGGFTKLLNYAVGELKKNNPAVGSVITFADNEVSDGALYRDNGFLIDAYLRPDYKYIYKNRRYHKFLFRKKRFEKDPDLLFDENMTERELSELNNIHRIWDCGKTKYVKKV